MKRTDVATEILLANPGDDTARGAVYAFDDIVWSCDVENGVSDQAAVYKAAGEALLANALKGFNCCCFAYGQTGSGKTHTMMGDPHHPDTSGLIPRVSTHLFDELSATSSRRYQVSASYMEIYQEQVLDLITTKGFSSPSSVSNLKVRTHPTDGVYVENLSRHKVSSVEELLKLIRVGAESRHTAATKMNAVSSRSHALLTIFVNAVELVDSKDGSEDGVRRFESKVNLVDLAGSERTKKSEVEGGAFTEATKINLSLTTLGRVIDSLAGIAGSTTVPPYRESLLTYVLSDSLGGNSKTAMLATVSPHSSNYEETQSTLRYASRARKIVNHAVINEEGADRNKIKAMKEEIDRLNRDLMKSRSKEHISELIDLRSDRERYAKHIKELTERNHALTAKVTALEIALKQEKDRKEKDNSKQFARSHTDITKSSGGSPKKKKDADPPQLDPLARSVSPSYSREQAADFARPTPLHDVDLTASLDNVIKGVDEGVSPEKKQKNLKSTQQIALLTKEATELKLKLQRSEKRGILSEQKLKRSCEDTEKELKLETEKTKKLLKEVEEKNAKISALEKKALASSSAVIKKPVKKVVKKKIRPSSPTGSNPHSSAASTVSHSGSEEDEDEETTAPPRLSSSTLEKPKLPKAPKSLRSSPVSSPATSGTHAVPKIPRRASTASLKKTSSTASLDKLSMQADKDRKEAEITEANLRATIEEMDAKLTAAFCSHNEEIQQISEEAASKASVTLTEMEASKEEVQTLKKKLITVQEAASSHHISYVKFKKEKETAETELAAAKSTIDIERTKLAELNTKHNKLEEETHALRTQQNIQSVEMGVLKGQILEAEALAADAALKETQHHTQTTLLKEQLDAVEATITSERAASASLRKHSLSSQAASQGDIASLKEELVSLRSEKTAAIEAKESFYTRLMQAEQSKADATRSCNELRAEANIVALQHNEATEKVSLQVEAMKGQLSEKEKSLERVERKCSTAENEVSTLKEKLSAVVASSEGSATAMLRERSEWVQEKEDLERDLAAAKDAEVLLKTQLSALSADQVEADGSRAKLVADLSQHAEEMSALQRENHDLNKNVASLTNAVHTAEANTKDALESAEKSEKLSESRISTIEASFESATTQITEKEEVLGKQRHQISQLESHAATLSASLGIANKDIEVLRGKYEMENESHTAEITSLTTQRTALEAANTALQQEAIKAEQRHLTSLAEVTHSADTAAEKVVRLEAECARLSTLHSAALSDLAADIAMKEQSILVLTTTAEEQASGAQNQILQIQNEAESHAATLLQSRDSALEDVASLRATLGQCETHIVSLQSRISEAEGESMETKTQAELTQTQLTGLEETNTTLTTTLEASSEEIKRLQGELRQRAAKVSSLEAELSESEGKLRTVCLDIDNQSHEQLTLSNALQSAEASSTMAAQTVTFTKQRAAETLQAKNEQLLRSQAFTALLWHGVSEAGKLEAATSVRISLEQQMGVLAQGMARLLGLRYLAKLSVWGKVKSYSRVGKKSKVELIDVNEQLRIRVLKLASERDELRSLCKPGNRITAMSPQRAARRRKNAASASRNNRIQKMPKGVRKQALRMTQCIHNLEAQLSVLSRTLSQEQDFASQVQKRCSDLYTEKADRLGVLQIAELKECFKLGPNASQTRERLEQMLLRREEMLMWYCERVEALYTKGTLQSQAEMQESAVGALSDQLRLFGFLWRHPPRRRCEMNEEHLMSLEDDHEYLDRDWDNHDAKVSAFNSELRTLDVTRIRSRVERAKELSVRSRLILPGVEGGGGGGDGDGDDTDLVAAALLETPAQMPRKASMFSRRGSRAASPKGGAKRAQSSRCAQQ